MSCEFDCLRTYSCSAPIEAGTVAIGGERYPGAVFAPWVQVGIEGEGTNITVGNRSSPPDNHAIIKSFEYGFSEGAGVKIEIFDEEGSSLSTFVNRLSKTLCEASQDYKMSLDFGWIIQYCDGSIEMNRASDHGNRLWFLPLKIEMSLENGKIKYTIEGTDLQDRISENRLENAQGREDNLVDLKSAIETMFRESCPRIEKVLFEDKYGNEWDFDNSNGGPRGPRSVWTTDQQNALATTRKWIAPLTTGNGKGIVFQWKPDEETPCIVLLEDPNSAPDENDPCCDVHLATYIVNGGNCLYGPSTVLTERGWERIEYLVKYKYNGLVRCVDENANPTWGKVTNWYKSKRMNRKMKKIHLSSSRKHYKNTSGAIFTEDHEILTDKGYVAICNLKGNEKIHSGTLCPVGKTYEAFIGTMLGDSYITTCSNKFECRHSFAQESYLRHKAELFGLNVFRKKRSWSMSGKANGFIRKMSQVFYRNGRKIVPEEAIRQFSVVSLAYLFMDDGSTSFRPNKKPRAEIAVCAFIDQEVDEIVNAIKKLGIDCYRKKYGNYNRIKFSTASTVKLSEIIAPYVHDDLQYKLLPQHRNMQQLLKREEGVFYDDFEIVDVPNIEHKTKTVYCIGVEKHNNFLTHSGIVHNCSPVLQFSPQVNWTLAANAGAGGQQAGGVSAGHEKQEGRDGSNVERVGTQTQFPVNQNDVLWRGPEDIVGKAQDANAAHEAAVRFREVPSSITAELKIIGDPSLAFPLGGAGLIGRTVSIVVINPFYITGGSACEWLASPPCNQILSNKRWMIQGANHQIREGSYTTTLKLFLEVPNVELNPGEPLGGRGCGTLTFDNDQAQNPGD